MVHCVIHMGFENNCDELAGDELVKAVSITELSVNKPNRRPSKPLVD